MIDIRHKRDCCGCEACVQKCPKQCITLSLDKEGFLYPKVDINDCINCHLCERGCPIINFDGIPHLFNPKQSLAVKNRNDNLRMNSSSGGVFISLAIHIIDNGGVVFGAIFDDEFGVKHTSGQSLSEIQPMMGSKYVQSQIGDSFSRAESFLKQGKTVLFTGTPCQIAGLYTYLGKDYSNLFTVDIVCHGVPGPGVWNSYLNYIRHGSKVTSISFREKNGYSWSHYGLKIATTDQILYEDYASNNAYMRAFLSNNSLRPSCYFCKHKRRSGADITLGDFWGIKNILPEFADETGISMVVINTDKGSLLFKALQGLETKKVDTSILINCNRSFGQSSPIPLSRRSFFRLMKNESLNLDDIMRNIMPLPHQQTSIQRILFFPTRVCRLVYRRFQQLQNFVK